MKVVSFLILFLMVSCSSSSACDRLNDGQVRGITCFQCMYPPAKKAGLRMVDALAKSCNRTVALAYALDGSFGYDPKVVFQAVSKLQKAGQTVRVHLYYLNGPVNRRAPSDAFGGFLNATTPVKLRNDIRFVKAVRQRIAAFVREKNTLVERLQRKGVKLVVSPMLEDNLDDASFVALSDIVKQNINVQRKVEWVRNPCPDCAIGNEKMIPKGFLQERHVVDAPVNPLNQIISNDGSGFVYFKNEELPPLKNQKRGERYIRAVTFDRLAEVRDGAPWATFLDKQVSRHNV